MYIVLYNKKDLDRELKYWHSTNDGPFKKIVDSITKNVYFLRLIKGYSLWEIKHKTEDFFIIKTKLKEDNLRKVLLFINTSEDFKVKKKLKSDINFSVSKLKISYLEYKFGLLLFRELLDSDDSNSESSSSGNSSDFGCYTNCNKTKSYSWELDDDTKNWIYLNN